MHILGAVESRWRAGANTVGAEDLNGAFLEVRVRAESVEIVGCEVCDGAAIGELGFGTSRPGSRGNGSARCGFHQKIRRLTQL